MEWLNEGVGLIVVISSVIVVLLLTVIISVLLILRNKISVQRLNFLGFYATNAETRERFAECTIGNRSLNEVALNEIGIRNGKISFNLTALYKRKKGLPPEARIVIEQRSSIRFSLTERELMDILTDGKRGKTLKTLRLYAVDLTGNLYQGKVSSVRRLLAELLAAEKHGEGGAPLPPAGNAGAAPLPEAEPVAEPAFLPEVTPAGESPAEERAEGTSFAEEEIPAAETAPYEEAQEIPAAEGAEEHGEAAEELFPAPPSRPSED